MVRFVRSCLFVCFILEIRIIPYLALSIPCSIPEITAPFVFPFFTALGSTHA